MDKRGDEQEEEEKPEPSLPGRRRYGRRMGDIKDQDASSHMWIVSFTDVMALMLTFFVMLFAMSEPAKQDWSEMTSALNNEFNKFYGPLFNRGPVDAINIARIDFDQALDINYLSALLDSIIVETPSLSAIEIIPQPGSLVIALPQDLLFDSGQADIKDVGARALYALGGSLSRIKNKIEVAGHADPRPIQGENAKFGSNWELSLARAANVAALLNSVGYEKNIDVRGFSSGRYDDLAAIEDQERRESLSRRVDIVILDHDGRKKQLLFDLELP